MTSQVKSGKAFEFTLLNALYDILREKNMDVNVVDSSSLSHAMSYYAECSKAERKAFDDSAKIAAAFFPDVEPMLFYQKGNSKIDLSLASDSSRAKRRC